MSNVQKVTLLNKPIKLGIMGIELTWLQWLLMLVATIVAFVVGSNFPFNNIKAGGAPLGLWVGLAVFCAALIFIHMSEMKPWCWWRNLFYYRLHVLPSVFLPHPEEAPIYPDPTKVDAKKRTDDEEIYVEAS